MNVLTSKYSPAAEKSALKLPKVLILDDDESEAD